MRIDARHGGLVIFFVRNFGLDCTRSVPWEETASGSLAPDAGAGEPRRRHARRRLRRKTLGCRGHEPWMACGMYTDGRAVIMAASDVGLIHRLR